MSKIGAVLIIVLSFACLSWKVDNGKFFKHILFWESNPELTWNDFQGEIDRSDPHIVAITASSIIHHTDCENGKLTYEISAGFEKDKSWVSEAGLTDHHLKHEQLHFDITELYVRKLHIKLKNTNLLCHEEDKLNKIIQRHLIYWQAEQIQYDIDTQHSNNHSEQIKWQEKIEKDLKSFPNQ